MCYIININQKCLCTMVINRNRMHVHWNLLLSEVHLILFINYIYLVTTYNNIIRLFWGPHLICYQIPLAFLFPQKITIFYFHCLYISIHAFNCGLCRCVPLSMTNFHVISLALHISHNNIILQVTVFITTRTVRDQFLPEISSLVAKDQFLGLRSSCPRIAFPW